MRRITNYELRITKYELRNMKYETTVGAGDVRRMGAGEPRPYGGKHATLRRLRNGMHSCGMQVAVVRHIISTERFIPNGMSTKNQKFLLYIG